MRLFLTAIKEAISIYPVWIFMAHQDVVSKYRRTSLGPWWITLGTGIGLFGMGLIWARMFHTPLAQLFPYLSIGFVIWNFIATTLTESPEIFVRAAPVLKTIKIPLLTFLFFSVLKNLYVLAHNFMIIVVVLVIFRVTPGWQTLLVLPGLVLLALSALLASFVLGFLGARLRDLSHIMASLLTFLFLLTPIMWNTKILTGNSIYLAYLNPLTHYLSLVRDPLLGKAPPLMAYAAVSGCIFFMIGLSFFLFKRFHKRLIFWI